MKRKGKYVLVGAIFVTLIMVSSACAVNVVSNNLIPEKNIIQKDRINYPKNLV